MTSSAPSSATLSDPDLTARLLENLCVTAPTDADWGALGDDAGRATPAPLDQDDDSATDQNLANLAAIQLLSACYTLPVEYFEAQDSSSSRSALDKSIDQAPYMISCLSMHCQRCDFPTGQPPRGYTGLRRSSVETGIQWRSRFDGPGGGSSSEYPSEESEMPPTPASGEEAVPHNGSGEPPASLIEIGRRPVFRHGRKRRSPHPPHATEHSYSDDATGSGEDTDREGLGVDGAKHVKQVLSKGYHSVTRKLRHLGSSCSDEAYDDEETFTPDPAAGTDSSEFTPSPAIPAARSERAMSMAAPGAMEPTTPGALPLAPPNTPMVGAGASGAFDYMRGPEMNTNAGSPFYQLAAPNATGPQPYDPMPMAPPPFDPEFEKLRRHSSDGGATQSEPAAGRSAQGRWARHSQQQQQKEQSASPGQTPSLSPTSTSTSTSSSSQKCIGEEGHRKVSFNEQQVVELELDSLARRVEKTLDGLSGQKQPELLASMNPPSGYIDSRVLRTKLRSPPPPPSLPTPRSRQGHWGRARRSRPRPARPTCGAATSSRPKRTTASYAVIAVPSRGADCTTNSPPSTLHFRAHHLRATSLSAVRTAPLRRPVGN